MKSLVYAVLCVGFLICGVLWLLASSLAFGPAHTVAVILFLTFQIAGAGFFLATVYSALSSPVGVRDDLYGAEVWHRSRARNQRPSICLCGRSPCACGSNPIPQPQGMS